MGRELWDAIKVTLEFVDRVEDGQHPAQGSLLSDKERAAVELLKRATSGELLKRSGSTSREYAGLEHPGTRPGHPDDMT